MVPPFVNNPLNTTADDHEHPDDHHHGDFSPEDLHVLLGTLDGAHDATTTTAATTDSTKIDADAKAQARTERKRSREKQRRSDVNKQFHELTATLRTIESECDPSLLANANLYSSTTNRADLIARTITLLKNLHDSHKKQTVDLENLQQELDTSKQVNEETAQKLKDSMMSPHNVGGGKMMMMVPVMMNSDPSASSAGFMPFLPNMPTMVQPTEVTTTTTSDAPQQQQQWGMMPPWMNMMMVPPAPPMPDRKQAPKSQSTESGNLAHCA